MSTMPQVLIGVGACANQEDLQDPAKAAQDHALVQRLDTAAVHWTRQVKAVVHGKDVGAREDDGACSHCQLELLWQGGLDP